MGRGKSNAATAAFCKEQIDEVSILLDEHVNYIRFSYDFNQKAYELTNDISLQIFLQKYSYGLLELLNEEINGFNKLRSLSILNLEIKNWLAAGNSTINLSDQEKQTLLDAIKIGSKFTSVEPTFANGLTFKELAYKGQGQVVGSLYYSNSENGEIYRYAIREWADRFEPHLSFIKNIYAGRKCIPRSGRVTYKELEEIAVKMQNGKVDKLTAYKEFRAIKTQVDEAIAAIVNVLVEQQPLQSLSVDLNLMREKAQVFDKPENFNNTLAID